MKNACFVSNSKNNVEVKARLGRMLGMIRNASLLFAYLLILLGPSDAAAKTWARIEYLLAKPVGSLGSQFKSGFYGGLGLRQPIGSRFHGFFHVGATKTRIAIRALRTDIVGSQEQKANVDILLLPISLGMGIGPQEGQMKIIFSLGVTAVMASSKYNDNGPVPAEEIPLQGMGIGPFVDLGMFSIIRSGSEVSLSIRLHVPSFKLQGEGIQEGKLSLPFILFTLGIGKGFGKN